MPRHRIDDRVLLAFAGGIILNLMPCVLPVLSIKVLALVQHSQSTRARCGFRGSPMRRAMLASFAVIGGALIGAARGRRRDRLGIPAAVADVRHTDDLSAVCSRTQSFWRFRDRRPADRGRQRSGLARGLRGLVLHRRAGDARRHPVHRAVHGSGFGYAVTQPWYVSLAVLEAIGFGLAFPYLVIAFSPRARGVLPKPGIWMVRLKEILAFPVYGTAVWLMYVLSQQVGASGDHCRVGWSGADRLRRMALRRRRLERRQLAAIGHRPVDGGALSAHLRWLSLVDDGGHVTASNVSPSSTADANLDWQPFSQAEFEALRAEGRPDLHRLYGGVVHYLQGE